MRLHGLDDEQIEIEAREWDLLATRLSGSLHYAGDPQFDASCRIWNGMVPRTPGVVARPSSTDDVRRVVDFAATHGVLLSVRAGGHHVAGIALADGALALDMRQLRTVEVDPEGRLARVGGGCLSRDIDAATSKYELATALSWDGGVGVAGLTLGGGFGYLTPRSGATLDELVETEIVTADGAARRASANENEDLFWAVRGGGGNFGVVTRFTFRLHTIGPRVTGGILLWDARSAERVIEVYREIAESASRDLSVSLIMRLAPPAPFLPAEWHGKPIIAALICHFGDLAQAEKDLAPLRRAAPAIDLVIARPYAEQQALLDRIQPPLGMHSYWKSEFLGGLAHGFLEAFHDAGRSITSPLAQAQLFRLGGALADHDPAATAFVARDAAFSFIAAGCWPPAYEADAQVAWVRSAWERVRPYSVGRNYINAQTADEDLLRIEEAYGGNLARLRTIKARYDPRNILRVNRNIPPAA
jgi:FAD/FMN-containing dehydrogenase